MAGLPYCTEAKARVIAAEAAASSSGGTQVVANPTLAGTEETLTGLQVGDTKYKVAGGGGETKEITFTFSAGPKGTYLTDDGTGTMNPGFIALDENFELMGDEVADLFKAGEVWVVIPNRIGEAECIASVGVAGVVGNNFRILSGGTAKVSGVDKAIKSWHFGKTSVYKNSPDSEPLPGYVLRLEFTDNSKAGGPSNLQSLIAGGTSITIKKIA